MVKRGIDYKSKSQIEIPLVLNSYDEIFSRFDPRSYSQRALSGDFIEECKKASFEKEDKAELKFFIPASQRNQSHEREIKKRLKNHFHKHYYEQKHLLKRLNTQGIFWFLAGCFLTVLTAILFENDNLSISLRILSNVAHPAGWFFLWEGLGKILLTSKEKDVDYLFYKKMSKSEISFVGY